MSIGILIKHALEEDLRGTDITTEVTIPQDLKVLAIIVAKESCILCGNDVARQVFMLYDHSLKYHELVKDGSAVKAGYSVASIEGSARSILSCERLALNFIQRLSGIATNTARFAEKIKPYGVKLLDTRKNIPGYRELEKYAVTCGGGENHRFGLHDQVLIKDNHIDLVGLQNAVDAVHKKYPSAEIEVECQNLSQIKEALQSSVQIIMLDNMPVEEMKEALMLCKGNVKTEISGNVTLDNIEELAKLCPDVLSVGRALTLNAPAVDFSLEMKK